MTLLSLLPLVCRMLQLTCFGDRVFYQDWWNAATIGAYWRTWWVVLLAPVVFPDAAACRDSCLPAARLSCVSFLSASAWPSGEAGCVVCPAGWLPPNRNQPVHKWLLRTVYFPAMKHGCNRCVCRL